MDDANSMASPVQPTAAELKAILQVSHGALAWLEGACCLLAWDVWMARQGCLQGRVRAQDHLAAGGDTCKISFAVAIGRRPYRAATCCDGYALHPCFMRRLPGLASKRRGVLRST